MTYRAAIPFVRAYKLKGAHGVDEVFFSFIHFVKYSQIKLQFLSNLPESEAQHNSTTQEQFISSFPSLDKVETEMPKEIAVGNFESMENVTKYFDELLTISDPEDVSCQILSRNFQNLVSKMRTNEEAATFITTSIILPKFQELMRISHFLSPLLLTLITSSKKVSLKLLSAKHLSTRSILETGITKTVDRFETKGGENIPEGKFYNIDAGGISS